MAGDLVLVVDDEENIQDIARMYLEQEGYTVQCVGDGNEAVKNTRTMHPALIILDIMLPGMDGFAVCRTIRNENNEVPVLMLTARDDDIDKILGLELGADDYMTKPFNPRELVARVKAVLRRQDRHDIDKQGVLQVGGLLIDLDRREVRWKDRIIELRTQEFEVLKVLAQKPGWVFTREQLLSIAWGFDFYGQTRTVDVHIAQIRRRLEGTGVKIETVTGIGYKLTA
ncbi:MAG: response regulator transcription factor [Chloroflexi bacterium]|nr:response regulator transcription factor [Chloroflexota bacterium]